MGTLQYGTLGFIRYYKTQIEARAAFVLFSFPLVLILLNSRCCCTLLISDYIHKGLLRLSSPTRSAIGSFLFVPGIVVPGIRVRVVIIVSVVGFLKRAIGISLRHLHVWMWPRLLRRHGRWHERVTCKRGRGRIASTFAVKLHRVHRTLHQLGLLLLRARVGRGV